MIKLLPLALFINLGVMSIAAAQPAARTPDDFSVIGAGRTITVVTDSGQRRPPSSVNRCRASWSTATRSATA